MRASIRSIADIPVMPVERATGATLQILLGPHERVPHFVMRLFTLEPGARIPLHRHDTIEHEQLVLEGEMVLTLDGREEAVGCADCILIPSGTAHAYENRGESVVRFICVVPKTDSYRTDWLE